MELTEKNGQASMEEILASIRRIIAEEPGGLEPLIDLDAPLRQQRGDGLLDDPSDFDLPSMFRAPATPAPERPAPLFGRLSEAIRAASSGSHATESGRPEPALASLRLHRTETADGGGERGGNGPAFLLSTFHETTGARGDEPVPAASLNGSAHHPSTFQPHVAPMAMTNGYDHTASHQPAGEPAEIHAATASLEVPRQMAAFKDTRFRGMGAAPALIDHQAPAVSPFEAAATAALVAASEAGHAHLNHVHVAPSYAALAEEVTEPEVPAGLADAIAASYPALPADHAATSTPRRARRRFRRRRLRGRPAPRPRRSRMQPPICCGRCCASGWPTTCPAWSRRPCTSRWLKA